jgi:hypothetical protein
VLEADECEIIGTVLIGSQNCRFMLYRAAGALLMSGFVSEADLC